MSNVPEVKSAQAAQSKDAAVTWVIPDVIEERRKDAEGRVFTNKYARGKLLGKVSHLHSLHRINALNIS